MSDDNKKNPYEDNYNEEEDVPVTPPLSNFKTEKGKPPMEEEESSQTEKAFTDYCEQVLENKIKDAESKNTEAESSFDSNMETRRVKTKDLIWARRTHQEYSMFCNNVSAMISQRAVEVNGNIGSLKNMNGELSTKLSAAIEAIKNAKSKLAAADAAALALGEGIKDACNSQQVKIIREDLKKQAGASKKDLLKTCVDDIIQCSDRTHDLADDTFEMAVKISGINAFTNIDSLAEFGTTTEANINAFHADVATNIEYAMGQVATIQDQLKATLTDLTTAEYQTFKTGLNLTALKDTKEFAKDKTAPKENDINSICLAVERTFNQPDC